MPNISLRNYIAMLVVGKKVNEVPVLIEMLDCISYSGGCHT